MDSAEIFLIGSSIENLSFLEIKFICLYTHDFLFDTIEIPPSLIDLFLSGIILFISTDLLNPIPLQVLHDPLGELKEKLLGSGTS